MKCFKNLRGLIYFTDGKGIFPSAKPPYDTAFVFMKDNYEDAQVPSWAIKLIIEPEELQKRVKKDDVINLAEG
jgi:predicted metal-dependent peptidase